MKNTGIEWTDDTWNPIRGCSRVSEGCRNCYAERIAARFSGPGMPYEGLARNTSAGPRWTGKVNVIPEKLADPLRWQRPRRVFVNSTSDLFHPEVSFQVIAAIFGVMGAARRHTHQVLTKRPERQLEFMRWIMRDGPEAAGAVAAIAASEMMAEIGDARGLSLLADSPFRVQPFPFPNVWLGVSVEHQAAADERIPLLLETPARVRWISAEPLLGPVDLSMYRRGLDWIVPGAESGPGARPMDVRWVESLRDYAGGVGAAFFYKQAIVDGRKVGLPYLDGRQWAEYPEPRA